MDIRQLKVSLFVLSGTTFVTFILMSQCLRSPTEQNRYRQADYTSWKRKDPDVVFTYDLLSNLSILEMEKAIKSDVLPLESALFLLSRMNDSIFQVEEYIRRKRDHAIALCSSTNSSSGDIVSLTCSKSNVVPKMVNKTEQANKTMVESYENKRTFVSDDSRMAQLSKIEITLPDLKSQTVKKTFFLYDRQFKNSLMRKGNPFGIRYSGPDSRFKGSPNVSDVMCRMKNTNAVKTLTKETSPFKEINIAEHFPGKTFTEMYKFSRCAVVGSSFHLNQSGLGDAIDNHDAVLRFNDAPTVGFEKDVGTKTTFRVMNSRVFEKVCTKELPSCPNATLLIWKTGPYNGNLYKWYIQAKSRTLFSKYIAWRTAFPSQDIFLIHPKSLWLEWDTLAFFSTSQVKAVTPSSGFTGIVVLLGVCDTVDVYGYIGDDIPNYQCHYYDDIASCRGGQWHPTSNEKAIIKAANVRSSASVMTLKGYNKFNCTT
ncbi:beta-galactoside alpha-2,6-sialyltransferase 1-like [Ptychodera flava]|uniref:beta-galactoside alpha-2,6-sialyltransferase 1-like n=1 Tax=Ptychodera flava TaxID=63121 RepID=UPI00396A62E1